MGRVVVLDDLKEALDLMVEVLSPLGHEVRTFLEPHEAVAFLRGQTADLLILDVTMPGTGMDGLDVLQELHQNGHTPHPRVVLFCGDREKAEGVRRQSPLPVQEILAKPYSLSGLASLVERLLDGA